MIDYFDPEKLDDTAAASLRKNLGEQAALEGHLAELLGALQRLPESAPPQERSELQLNAARAMQVLERGQEAWLLARTAFDTLMQMRDWERAADCCDIMYQCGQADSLVALGQGIWLGVTYPIDPEITVHLLSHVVDDTPDDSDGAAVAAATACFLTDARAPEGPDRERLLFFSQQLLGRVARRHSAVESQAQFDSWIDRLQLNDPDQFLARLRNVVDVLVQDQWWFDRATLQAQIPTN